MRIKVRFFAFLEEGRKLLKLFFVSNFKPLALFLFKSLEVAPRGRKTKKTWGKASTSLVIESKPEEFGSSRTN